MPSGPESDSSAHAEGADLIRATVVIRGTVQGVGFRWWTARQADELALTGSVANESDGSVRLIAQGPRASVEELVLRLRSREAPGRVERIVQDVSSADPDCIEFRIQD
ncbi:acylphosphatase [Paenarthrobacter sp. Z7-10]|uniref:acylphosphatase n=1 Tax=Paenarthrobacter sp. Z7-10 TaxID=2787635 RepID=UPI0022A9A4A8|nr:acylphosphatase [Paenarthrobacter sp. Z7-10]MCZ2403643.1 acylphosphatase [Paenarthrobacter sp. Z7-10]